MTYVEMRRGWLECRFAMRGDFASAQDRDEFFAATLVAA